MATKIIDYGLQFTWSDGIIETMNVDLPEYLRNEIEAYLQELVDLRDEQGSEYVFSSN